MKATTNNDTRTVANVGIAKGMSAALAAVHVEQRVRAMFPAVMFAAAPHGAHCVRMGGRRMIVDVAQDVLADYCQTQKARAATWRACDKV